MSDNLKFSTLGRILIYLVILLICSLIGVAFTFLLLLAGDTGLLLGQGISSILMFIVPPIVYYYVTRKQNPVAALGLRSINRPWGFYILIGVVLMFASLPVTNQLTEWNEGMSFGPAFAKLEEYLKTMEEAAAEVTERMLNVDTFGGLLLNLLVIALIPAIGEELTFRGLLQQSLTRSMKNPHVAIILTGAIFSFIHFQFYGFLPRMFLGILLGYMFYISGSLWTSMAMHFVNNGTAVVVYYLNHKGIIDVDVDHFGAMSLGMVALSTAVTVALIVWSWHTSQKRKGL